MRITYSPRALRDLAEIADYLLQRSPRGARAVEVRIREVIALLADFPGIGRFLEQRPAVRVFPLGKYPYLVFYTTSADELIVLHVRHAARRPIRPDEV